MGGRKAPSGAAAARIHLQLSSRHIRLAGIMLCFVRPIYCKAKVFSDRVHSQAHPSGRSIQTGVALVAPEMQHVLFPSTSVPTFSLG